MPRWLASLPDPRREAGLLFWGALLVMIYEVQSGMRWAIADIIIRTNPDMWDRFPSQQVGFVLEVGLLEEILFFSAVAGVIVSLVLHILRHPAVLPVFAISILMSKTDWVLSSVSPFASQSLMTYFSVALEGGAIWFLFRLGQLGFFRNPGKPS